MTKAKTNERPFSSWQGGSGAENNKQTYTNSLTDQRQRILNHLRVNIESHRVNDVTEAGKTYRAARYILRIEGGDHD